MNAQSPRAYVRLTDPAIADLRRLRRSDPQIVKWALKKMLLLERDPMAGEPLLGTLIGYRKLVVSNRDWRIVWRVTTDDLGHVVVDIAEIWAVGARSDGEVYAEMRARLDAITGPPTTSTLEQAVGELARAAWGIEPSIEPASEPLPGWLVQKLTGVARIPANEVAGMNLRQAFDAWTAWMNRTPADDRPDQPETSA